MSSNLTSPVDLIVSQALIPYRAQSSAFAEVFGIEVDSFP